jgi:uncharacterized protein (TIGR00297 family)
MGSPQRTASERRDKLQSAGLVIVVAPLLACGGIYLLIDAARLDHSLAPWIVPLLASSGFAALVWFLRAATLPASAIGFLVCLVLSQSPKMRPLSHTALPALIMLFLLTFAATRFGRSKKEARNLAERRSGRRASQVVANLGVAALCSLFGWYGGCIAALAEAAADTVSSEVGQAIGGPAWLITTGRRVPAGTDGGISVAGTAAGVVAAGLIVAVGMAHSSRWADAPLVFAASCAGLLFDSLLGAMVERRGWLGNDLVNFCSTAFAAGLAIAWLRSR